MTLPKGTILKARDFQIRNGKAIINPQSINNKPGMLLIRADWCGHCTRFISTFNEIHRSIGYDFTCASIENEDVSESLSSALGIKGFPTIKFFDQRGSIIAEYNGDRSKSDILDHVCKVYHKCVVGK